jgi:hypothetical protein
MTDQPGLFDEIECAAYVRRHVARWGRWRPASGRRVRVCSCVVHSITHNEPRYHYDAPCMLVQALDGDFWTACVDYANGWCREAYNGEVLKLHLVEMEPQ